MSPGVNRKHEPGNGQRRPREVRGRRRQPRLRVPGTAIGRADTSLDAAHQQPEDQRRRSKNTATAARCPVPVRSSAIPGEHGRSLKSGKRPAICQAFIRSPRSSRGRSASRGSAGVRHSGGPFASADSHLSPLPPCRRLGRRDQELGDRPATNGVMSRYCEIRPWIGVNQPRFEPGRSPPGHERQPRATLQVRRDSAPPPQRLDIRNVQRVRVDPDDFRPRSSPSHRRMIRGETGGPPRPFLTGAEKFAEYLTSVRGARPPIAVPARFVDAQERPPVRSHEHASASRA